MASMWDFLQELRAFRLENVLIRTINEIASPIKGRIPAAEWQHAYSEEIAAIYEYERQLSSRRI